MNAQRTTDAWYRLSRRLDRFRAFRSSAALTHYGCGSFSPAPNPAKHLLAHREAEQFSGLDDEPSPRPRVCVTLTHEQPGRSVLLLTDRERPGEVVWCCTLSHRDSTAENK